MTVTAETWLPDSALSDVRSAEDAARCIKDWSTAWLASGNLSAGVRWEQSADPNLSAPLPVYDGPGFRILMREDGQRELASLIIGQHLSERSVKTASDQAVVDHLTGKALDNLGNRLGQLFDADDQYPNARGDTAAPYVLPVNGDGLHPLLWIMADRRIVVKAALNWTGPAQRRPPPQTLRPALAEQQVRLSAHIGVSRLTLAEIDALGAGDVLPLDTDLSARLPACIDDAVTGAVALSVHADDGRPMLQIERPPTQW